MSETVRYIQGIIANEYFLFDIREVKEVIIPHDLHDIPEKPEGVLGLAKLNDRYIPVFDLGWMFGLKKNEETLTRALVTEGKRGTIALALPLIKGVVNVELQNVQETEFLEEISQKRYLLGIYEYEGIPHYIVQLRILLDEDERFNVVF